MREVDAVVTVEKNKAANKPLYLYTIHDFDGNSNNLYYAGYQSDIVFNGQTYLKFPISHDTISENSQGTIDTVRVVLSNISREVQAYLEVYDFRSKKVTIRLVWANELDEADAYLDEIYYIDHYEANAKDVTFTLTSRFDVLEQSIPAAVYTRTICRYPEFKGPECQYAGGETSCNRTFQRCKELQNTKHFGGQPATPAERIVLR